MALNLGKNFEDKFKENWKESFPDGDITRIYDTMNGYGGVSNVCDFFGYVYPNIFYIECKSHKGASFPIDNLTQYEKLKAKVGIHGVRAGMVLWLIEKDKVYYVPISTITKLIEDNYKSINPEKLIPEGYIILELPSKKLRTYLDTDYSSLKDLPDNY